MATGRLLLRTSSAILDAIPAASRQQIFDTIREQLDVVVHKFPNETFLRYYPFDFYVILVDGIQKKGGSSWVAGTVYLSHTVGTAGAPLPLSQQAFVQLRWRDREATHKPHNVEDDTFYFYLKMSDAAEILPEIAYAGMQPKDRAVLNGLQALLPPLPPHEAIWGKELLANRSPSGVEPKER